MTTKVASSLSPSSPTGGSISDPHPIGWTESQTTDSAVRGLFAQKMTQIAGSYHARELRFLQAKDSYESMSAEDKKVLLVALDQGFWYANRYAEMLQAFGQTERLRWLVEHDAIYHGHPPKGFVKQRKEEKSKSLTAFEYHRYSLKSDCLPTDGLRNVHAGTSACFLECAQAVQLAAYETLREIFGDEQFNAYFSGSGKTPLTLCPADVSTPLKAFGSDTTSSKARLGDAVYFGNIPLYGRKHANGEDSGFNTICLGNGKYVGFGIPPEGKTKDEIVDLLVEAFNRPPVSTSLFSASLEKQFVSDAAEAFAWFMEEAGGNLFEYQLSRENFMWAKPPIAQPVFFLDAKKIREMISSMQEARA